MPAPRHHAEIQESLQDPYRALAIAFLPRAQERLTRLAADFEEETTESLRRALHNLAGTAGSYGLRSLHGVLADIERELVALGDVLSAEWRTASQLRVLALAEELAHELADEDPA